MKTIGKALLTQHNILNTNAEIKTPLEYYLNKCYESMYIRLCNICDVKPISLAKWLLKPVDELSK